MVFKCVSYYSLYVDVEKSEGEQASVAYPTFGLEPFSYAVVIVDCTGCLVVEAFYGFDQVDIDAIKHHDYAQSCVPNSVEFCLEMYEDMEKV